MSQKPVNTTPDERNLPYIIYNFQDKIANTPTGRETQSCKNNLPLNNRHSSHSCRTKTKKIKTVRFAQTISQNQSVLFVIKIHLQIKQPQLIKITVTSKKLITGVKFSDSSRLAEPSAAPTPPISPASSSNISTPSLLAPESPHWTTS